MGVWFAFALGKWPWAFAFGFGVGGYQTTHDLTGCDGVHVAEVAVGRHVLFTIHYLALALTLERISSTARSEILLSQWAFALPAACAPA